MKTIYKILFAALVFRIVLAFLGWHPDINNHVDWGIRFWDYGPAKIYTANVWSFTWPNQPPGTMYLFAAIRKLYEGVFGFFSFLHFKLWIFPGRTLLFLEKTLYIALLKLPAILADIGMGYLIYRFFAKIGKVKTGLWASVLFLANPVIWYNSAFWGQTDAIINFLVLLAFILLLERKLLWATLAFIISFYIKASLLIFVPIFLIVLWRQKYKLREVAVSFLLPLAIVALLSLPFAKGNVFAWLIWLYEKKVFGQQLQIITANAFNLWAAIAGIHEKPQTLLLGPISYKLWGQILFGLALVPALWLVYKKQDAKSVFWSLAITAFSSFMLLTNMHERYLYPLFPALTILVGLDSKLLPLYLGVSGINLVNLYNFWWVPKINLLVNFLSFNDRLMPRVIGFTNFLLFSTLYYKFYLTIRVGTGLKK